jgi:WW domain.
MPPGVFMEPDLPPELLQQGWRKFWSKRQNRPYFWNKQTGESLWEMPQLKPQVSIHVLYLYVSLA